MRAAVLLLWAVCLFSISPGLRCLLLPNPWRQCALLAALALAASHCHRPRAAP